MSSITSGGITSTTLVCSLGMSPVDRASVKYKTKKVRLQNDLMRHSTVIWSYLSSCVCQDQQKVPALYTVSMFPRALFPALNTIYMFPRVVLLLHFFRALYNIKDIPPFTHTVQFPRFRRAETLIAVLSVSLENLSRKELTKARESNTAIQLTQCFSKFTNLVLIPLIGSLTPHCFSFGNDCLQLLVGPALDLAQLFNCKSVEISGRITVLASYLA